MTNFDDKANLQRRLNKLRVLRTEARLQAVIYDGVYVTLFEDAIRALDTAKGGDDE